MDGRDLKRIYTRAILPAETPQTACYPLNPFTGIQLHLNRMCLAVLALIRPEVDIFGRIFGSMFQMGNVTVLSAWFGKPTSDLPLIDTSRLAPDVNLEVRDSMALDAGPIGRMILTETANVDTVLLRRSARANKYDGFRVPPMSDRRIPVSKVKPRKDPHIAGLSTAGSSSARNNEKVSDTVPPPTSIHAIQSIGTNMCGVHPSQLSEDKLLATQEMHKSNTGGLDAA